MAVINLYDRKKHKAVKGELIFSSYEKKTKKNLIGFKLLAIACLIISLIGFTTLILPIAVAEARLRLTYLEQNLNSEDDTTPSFLPIKSMPLTFSIRIPKIGVTSDIISNVDAASPNDYNEKLMRGVAHAKGSYLPGQGGLTFLFAHSTDSPANILQYNAKFYAAKDLETGDEIIIDYHGKTYIYIVDKKAVTKPGDIGTIRSSDADLILQTCWPPGTNWQRLLIFAKQKK